MGNPSTSGHVHVFKPVSVCIYVTLGDDRTGTEGSESNFPFFFFLRVGLGGLKENSFERRAREVNSQDTNLIHFFL